MSLKVPFWKKSEIDNMAQDLLGKYAQWKGVTLSPPINIDDIVEGYLKLDLQLVDLKKLLSMPDVLGATWLEDKVIRIDASLEQHEGRLSFTMAHEVGHWWMHRPIYEMDKVTLPLFAYDEQHRATPAVICRSGCRKAPAEWQADQFAAMLLMPNSMVRASVATLQLREPLPINNYNLRDVAKKIIQSGFSNVSIQSMCYRLVDLGLVIDTHSQQISLQ